MKKTLQILGFFSFLLFFNVNSALATALVIEVSDNPETKTITYQCVMGENKERVKATYYNSDNISLVDFKWKDDRVIAAKVDFKWKDGRAIATNVIDASGEEYEGAQYIWWKTNNEVTLHDLLQDPEGKNLIHCKDESLLLF
ncbi:MliC family protein [Bartonella florencae]|uniref:MliC family protein n=1 Tax=Bartonella florencae TaxID=928210 RepID=UPI0002FEBEC5|nr:MliC family protein [Bartonella florencae]